MSQEKSQVQVENSDVRVTRWTLAVGDDTGAHVHKYDYVVVPITAGSMQITDTDGTQANAELAQGVSYFRRAGANHNVRNDGADVLDFVEVEVVRPAAGTVDVRDQKGE